MTESCIFDNDSLWFEFRHNILLNPQKNEDNSKQSQ